MDVEKLSDAVVASKERRDELKKLFESADDELKELQGSLARALRDSGEESLDRGGYAMTASTKVSWKPISDEKEHLVSVLKVDVPELVKETVNSVSLGSYLRKNEEELESASPSWWGELKTCLERTEADALSMRKSKKKK